MTQSDGTAIQVDLLLHLVHQLQILHARQALRCEGFVQLDIVDVVHGQTGTLECLLGRRHRAVTHDGGVTARHCHRADLGAGLQAQSLGTLGRHHQDGGSTVGQRRRSTGSYLAVLRIEHRLQLGQTFNVGFRTDHFVDFAQGLEAVSVVTFDGNDFILPAAFNGGFPGQTVGTGTELVHLLAGNTVHATEHFCRQTHHVGGLGYILGHLGIQVDAVHHADMAHVLHTADHEHIAVTGLDGLGSAVQCLHGRTTQTIHGLAGDSARQVRQDGDVAGDVHALLQGLVYTAPDHVFGFRHVPVRVTLLQAVDQLSRQFFSAYVTVLSILGFTHRGTDSVDNHCVSWIQTHFCVSLAIRNYL